MSAAPGVCSGRAPSPEPTRGFVATKRPLYWPPREIPNGQIRSARRPSSASEATRAERLRAARRRIAVDGPRMRGARPVRVQAERCPGGGSACALEPRLLRLAVHRVGRTHERDHVEATWAAALQPVEALPGGVVQRTLDMAR